MSTSSSKKQTYFLENFYTHLTKLAPYLKEKRWTNKLRNNNEFFDTYYELEVGNLLIENGFSFEMEPKLKDNINEEKTPDFFLKDERTIIDVKTLHENKEVMHKRQSHPFEVFEPRKYLQLSRIIINEMKKWKNGINYPLVIITCPDELDNTAIYSDDYETALFYKRASMKLFRDGSYFVNPKTTNVGLFYQDEGLTASFLSGVARLWKCHLKFWENPNANNSSKISEGKFLLFLRKN